MIKLETQLTLKEFKILVITLELEHEEEMFGLFEGDIDADTYRLEYFQDRLLEVSRHTDELIIAHCQSMDYAYEEGAESKTYFKNGKMKRYYPNTVWPEFNESDLA